MFKRLLLSFVVMFALVISGCGIRYDPDPNDPVIQTPGGEEPIPVEPEPPSGEMIRGEVFISDTQLLIMESFPVQIMLNIKGELPTPCNIFRGEVSPPNEENEIHVDAYSEVEEGAICITVMEPFEENVSIPMQGAPDGTYTIWVNGELVGEFSYPG